MSKFLFALILITSLQSALAADDTPAPFGLSWGMSTAQAEALHIELTKEQSTEYGVVASARNLPVTISDAEQVALLFGFDDRLWRVFVTSKVWSDDKFGTQALARYNELCDLLKEKYGKGQVFNRDPPSEYERSPEYFASSLSHKDRIVATEWKTGSVTIDLSLAANIYDTYYILSYENNAMGTAARKAIQSRDKNAL
jgi:hypothetical protein